MFFCFWIAFFISSNDRGLPVEIPISPSSQTLIYGVLISRYGSSSTILAVVYTLINLPGALAVSEFLSLCSVPFLFQSIPVSRITFTLFFGIKLGEIRTTRSSPIWAELILVSTSSHFSPRLV